MVDAIPTVASFLVGAEGPHCRLSVRYKPVYPGLCRQPSDIGQEAHDLPCLGGAHPGGDVGLVRSWPTLCDPRHGHALPASVALASTTTIVPRRVASTGRS